MPRATATDVAVRERRRGVVRGDCTVGLRHLRRARGRGRISCASERTVGKCCRQVAEGALVSFCASHRASQEWSAGPIRPSRHRREKARKEMCARGAFPRGNAPRAHIDHPPARQAGRFSRREAPGPAELVTASRSRRIATSSSAVHGSQQSQPPSRKRGQAERAAGLVLLDGEVAGGRVPVARAALGAQAQAPAGDDDRAAVVADLADLEDGRLATPGHGVLPSTVPLGRAEPCACVELDEISAGIGVNLNT